MIGMWPKSVVLSARPARPETDAPNSVPTGDLAASRMIDGLAGRKDSARPPATSAEAVTTAAAQATRARIDLGESRREGRALVGRARLWEPLAVPLSFQPAECLPVPPAECLPGPRAPML